MPFFLIQKLNKMIRNVSYALFVRRYQGMQSRDSCVQREQAPALRYCTQEP